MAGKRGSFGNSSSTFLQAYDRNFGIALGDPGLVVVRAVAKKDGWLSSKVYTSR